MRAVLDIPLAVSSDITILVLLAVVVGLLGLISLRSTARAFGFRLGGSPAQPQADAESAQAADLLLDSERRILDLFERLLPHHVARYVQQRRAAEGYGVSETIRLAMEVADSRDASVDQEFTLALAQLQAQVERYHAKVTELERQHAQSCEEIELLSTRVITPERVTVIASGMAVGRVLLLCAFGALLVAALGVVDRSAPAAAQTQTTAAPDPPRTASSGWCLDNEPSEIVIRPRRRDGSCPPQR